MRNISYKQVNSEPLSTEILKATFEAIAVIDVNNDGIRDIILTTSGDPAKPIAQSDPPISILFGDQDFRFTLANTSELAPTGWINDYIFADNNKNELLEIIAIDHGREIAYDESYWSRLHVYEFNPWKSAFVDISDLTRGNPIAFHHHSANTADINLDGFSDFIVAEMGPRNFRIYSGHPEYIFEESTKNYLGSRYEQITKWNSSSYVGPGAAGAIDIRGDGDFDFIILPYSDLFTQNQEFAQIFEFEGGQFVNDRLTNVRMNSSFTLPPEWGYSFFRVEDINGDKLPDIVAFAENPSLGADGTAIFISMIQNQYGGFEVSPSFPSEPLITERRGEIHAGTVWADYKFSLEDLDGDGDLDLFWGQWFGGKSSYLQDGIFINDGSGHFYRDTDVGRSIANQVTWFGNGGARTYMTDLNYDGIGDFLIFDAEYTGSQGLITVTAFISEVSDHDYVRSVVIGGLSDQYVIERSGETTIITDRLMSDGRLQFSLADRVDFQDTSFAFDTDGVAGQAYRIYKAAFDRAPDLAGLGYWIDAMDKGVALAGVAGGFIGSKEFQSRYGSTSDTDFIRLLYENVLDRQPDTEGYAYWQGAMGRGLTREGLLINFSESLENKSNVAGLIDQGIEYIPFIS